MQVSIHFGNEGFSEHKTWKIWVQSAWHFSLVCIFKEFLKLEQSFQKVHIILVLSSFTT